MIHVNILEFCLMDLLVLILSICSHLFFGLNAMAQISHEPKQLRWKPPPISFGIKQDWQDKFRNIRISRRGVDETGKDEDSKVSFLIYDDNLLVLNERNDAESKVKDSHIK